MVRASGPAVAAKGSARSGSLGHELSAGKSPLRLLPSLRLWNYQYNIQPLAPDGIPPAYRYFKILNAVLSISVCSVIARVVSIRMPTE